MTEFDIDFELELPQLAGHDDYFKWSHAFEVAVNAIEPRIWMVIEGTYPFELLADKTASITEQQFAEHLWKVQAAAWIQLGCRPAPLRYIQDIEDPVEAWRKLNEVYGGNRFFRRT